MHVEMLHERAYSESLSVKIFFLPESMDNMNLNEMPRIRVKGVHEKWNVVEKVELPATGYKRISQQIFERQRILILTLWEISNPGQLPRGWDRRRLFLNSLAWWTYWP